MFAQPVCLVKPRRKVPLGDESRDEILALLLGSISRHKVYWEEAVSVAKDSSTSPKHRPEPELGCGEGPGAQTCSRFLLTRKGRDSFHEVQVGSIEFALSLPTSVALWGSPPRRKPMA